MFIFSPKVKALFLFIDNSTNGCDFKQSENTIFTKQIQCNDEMFMSKKIWNIYTKRTKYSQGQFWVFSF